MRRLTSRASTFSTLGPSAAPAVTAASNTTAHTMIDLISKWAEGYPPLPTSAMFFCGRLNQPVFVGRSAFVVRSIAPVSIRSQREFAKVMAV